MELKVKLLLLLLSFMILWIISNINNMQVLWFVILGGSSIYFAVKNKNINKKDVLIGCILGLVSMPSSFIMGLFTIPCYLGSISVFKKSEKNRIDVLKTGRKQVFVSIILAVIIGCILGVLNLFLVNSEFNISFKLKWFLDAIRAGITEEVIFRMFLFAICVYLVKDKKLTRSENIICYLIMIVPHVLLHFQSIELEGIIILSVLFGLPFALFQRKRDLTSAIVSHSLVDLIRFIVTGV